MLSARSKIEKTRIAAVHTCIDSKRGCFRLSNAIRPHDQRQGPQIAISQEYT